MDFRNIYTTFYDAGMSISVVIKHKNQDMLEGEEFIPHLQDFQLHIYNRLDIEKFNEFYESVRMVRIPINLEYGENIYSYVKTGPYENFLEWRKEQFDTLDTIKLDFSNNITVFRYKSIYTETIGDPFRLDGTLLGKYKLSNRDLSTLDDATLQFVS